MQLIADTGSFQVSKLRARSRRRPALSRHSAVVHRGLMDMPRKEFGAPTDVGDDPIKESQRRLDCCNWRTHQHGSWLAK